MNLSVDDIPGGVRGTDGLDDLGDGPFAEPEGCH
jgi:hypothetical protein